MRDYASSFFKAIITLIQRPNKNILRKPQKKIINEEKNKNIKKINKVKPPTDNPKKKKKEKKKKKRGIPVVAQWLKNQRLNH